MNKVETDPDEVKAAVERKRLGEYRDINTWECGPHRRAISEQESEDDEILTDAYLAEHPPDDDEPIDEAWLRGLAGDRIIQDESSSLGQNLGIRLSETCVIFWTWCLGISEPHCEMNVQKSIFHRETRGDVRCLCDALGIKLKEGGRNGLEKVL